MLRINIHSNSLKILQKQLFYWKYYSQENSNKINQANLNEKFIQ